MDMKRFEMLLRSTRRDGAGANQMALAVQECNNMLIEAGLGWGDVLRTPIAHPSPAHSEIPVIELILQMKEKKELLTNWEIDFLDSVEKGVAKFGKATPKQMNVIYKIRDRIESSKNRFTQGAIGSVDPR